MIFSLFARLLAATVEHPRRVLGVLGVAIFVLLTVTEYMVNSPWMGAVPAAAILLSLVAGSLSTWAVLVEADIKRSGEHPDLFRFQFAAWLRQQKEREDDQED